MPRKKVWVEPKYDSKKEVIKLDISKMAINKLSTISDIWEMFVTITDEIPDVLVMNETQYMWYESELIDFANRLGTKIKNVNFKGMKIEVKS